MNTQHQDILTAIGRKQPVTSEGIAGYLMDNFGYGGGMEFDKFLDQVSKTISYLKTKGEIVEENIGFPMRLKGKPLRYWRLANNLDDVLEIASGVVEAEKETFVTTSKAVNNGVENRAKPRKPYTPNKIAGAYMYRGALVIKLDRKANAKSVTLSAKDMAMLTSIYGDMG